MQKVLMLSIIPAGLFFAERVWPCGPGEPDPLRFFRPESAQQIVAYEKKDASIVQALSPASTYCDSYNTSGQNASINDPNLDDWEKELQAIGLAHVDRKNLQELVYKMPAAMLASALQTKNSSNSIITKLFAKGQMAPLQYLLLAKKIEPHVNVATDAWEPAPALKTTIANPFIEQALQAETAGKWSGLRIRYLFQALRLAHYSGQYSRALALYQNLEAIKPGDPLYFRIKHLRAGALIKLNKKPQGLVALAELVAQDRNHLLDGVLLDFRLNYAEKGIYDAAYNQSGGQTRHYLSLLRFIADPAPGLALLKEAANRENSPVLDFMLLREIDRLEDRIESPLYYDAIATRKEEEGFSLTLFFKRLFAWFGGSLYAASYARIPGAEIIYMKQLEEFVGQILERKNTKSPAIWQLARAYLAYLQNNPAGTEKYLKSPLLENPENLFVRRLTNQLQLLAIVANAKSVDDSLAKSLEKFYPAFLPQRKNVECAEPAQLLLHRSMIKLSKDSGKPELAYLWEPDAGQIHSQSPMNIYSLVALKKALAILEKPETPYEHFLVRNMKVSAPSLRIRLGGRYLKEGQSQQALSTLKKAPGDALAKMYYSEKIQADPFSNPFSEGFAAGQSAKNWNALSIAERYVELQKTASSGPQKAESLYRLGLVTYNTSHFGAWWSAVDADWSVYYDYSEKKGDPQLLRAMEFFKQAIAAGLHKELEASARYMIAMISYQDETDASYSNAEIARLTKEQETQFQKLADFQDTGFFGKVIKECSYYRLFRK